MGRHVLAWLVVGTLCFWLFLLLAGDWNRIELVAAACAAAVAATLGEAARARVGMRAHVPVGWIASAWNAVAMIFVDFGIVSWALVRSAARRQVVRGAFRAHAFPAGGDDPVSAGRRAWVNYVANVSPNAYVVEIDRDRQLVLLHDLVPCRRSEEPA